MKRNNTTRIAWLTVIGSALIASGVGLGDAPSAQAQAPPAVTMSGFPASTPEEQGVDSARLAGVIDFLLENKGVFRIHSLIVIRNGRQVFEAHFHPFVPGGRHDIASVTKSFMATLIGIAIERGDIASVDERVLRFFPERVIANLDAHKEAMTIDHLLTMRSGLLCDPENEVTHTEMIRSADWVQFALDLPMAESPGQTRVYCNPNFHLLSAILQQASGLSALDFAGQHLFIPLGITDVMWPHDPQGVSHGWGDLQLQPLDMAKLGQVYLDAGVWQRRQVVPSGWIQQATTPPLGSPYAYHWEATPDYLEAEGRGGQKIRVYPELNLVVAQTGGAGWDQQTPYWELYPGLYETYILGAIRSDGPLAPNAEGVTQLNAKIAQAAVASEAVGPVSPLPATAHTISGRRYLLEPNVTQFSSFSFSFPAGHEALLQATLPVGSGGPHLELPVGLDGVFHLGTGRYSLSAAAQGLWESENQFVVLVDDIGLINLWRLSLTFEADTLRGELELVNDTLFPVVTIRGRVEN